MFAILIFFLPIFILDVSLRLADNLSNFNYACCGLKVVHIKLDTGNLSKMFDTLQ